VASAPAPAAAATPVASAPAPAAATPVASAPAPAAAAPNPAQPFLPALPVLAVNEAPLDDVVEGGDKPVARIGRPQTAPALAMVDGNDSGEMRVSGWGIQVGAYSHAAQARAAALRAKRSIAGLHRATISIARSHAGHGTIYRARLTGISAGEARAACSKIHRKRSECVVLNPGNERSLAEVRQ